MAGIFGWNLQTFVEISVLFLVLVSEMDAFQFASGGMNFPLRMLPKTQTQAKISSESGVTMQFQVDGLGKMSVWRDHLLAMATYGAILGPQLDDYWVPAMFALAAVILGITYPLLDNFFKEDKLSIPSPPKSLACWPALTGQTLYAYTAPDVHGIPLWIGWVYACGAPAVGGLSRITWEYMSSRKLRGTGHKD
eukprot:764574-Hanusia_phi.AAC.4